MITLVQEMLEKLGIGQLKPGGFEQYSFNFSGDDVTRDGSWELVKKSTEKQASFLEIVVARYGMVPQIGLLIFFSFVFKQSVPGNFYVCFGWEHWTR